jgi:alanine racemase
MSDIERQQLATTVNIDTDALAFNFHSAKQFIGSHLKYMAVVKGNAYGHSAVECSRRLEAEGIDWLAVALPEEAFELRNAGIEIPILCLRGSNGTSPERLIAERITPVLFQCEKIAEFNAAAKNVGKTANVHIKIDTGMGRVGVRFDEIDAVIAELVGCDSLNVEGLMTHFAAADGTDAASLGHTALQLRRFHECIGKFEQADIKPAFIDLANSPAAVSHPETRGNIVRLGGVLYGLIDDVLPPDLPRPETRPVMSLRTYVSSIKTIFPGDSVGYGRTFQAAKETRVATVPIGYADGLMRSLSNRGSAAICGKRAPIIGRVSMDWTTLDVTNIENVRIGTPVTFIGSDAGLRMSAEEMAAQAGTISYEVTCGISPRVHRTFLPEP